MGNKISYINLEPEKPALDGRHLEQLIELWKEDLKRRVKPQTYRNNVCYMNIFSGWWSKSASEFDWLINDVALAEFSHYLSRYRTRFGTVMSWHSQHTLVTLLKAMFRWAYRKNYVSLDFSVFVPNPKGRPSRKSAITLEDLDALVAEAGRSPYPIRNQAIIAVLAGTGIRSVECAALTIGDVSMTSDMVGTIRLRVTKGNRPRVVAFDRFTGNYLSVHLDQEAGSLSDKPLFATRWGVHFVPASIGTLIQILSTEAGIHIRAHDLRRMFATHWSRERPGEGYGALLQKQMGHSTFNMTTQYMLQDTEDLVKVMRNEAISPIAALHTQHNRSTT